MYLLILSTQTSIIFFCPPRLPSIETYTSSYSSHMVLVRATMFPHDPTPQPPATIDWSRDRHLTQTGKSELFPWIFCPKWNWKNIIFLSNNRNCRVRKTGAFVTTFLTLERKPLLSERKLSWCTKKKKSERDLVMYESLVPGALMHPCLSAKRFQMPCP